VLVGAIRADRSDEARDALAQLQVTALGLDADAARELAELRVRTGLRLPDCCVLYAALSQPPKAIATFDTRLAAGAVTLGIEMIHT